MWKTNTIPYIHKKILIGNEHLEFQIDSKEDLDNFNNKNWSSLNWSHFKDDKIFKTYTSIKVTK